MPRYLVVRAFTSGVGLPPMTAEGARACADITERNMEERVTWIQSFVSADKDVTFCVYDGPSPEAIRRAALRNGLPVDRIMEVRVLDPYFYY